MAAMAIIHRHREGLRRDDAAELRRPRKILIPVDRVGIVHRLDPAPDVGGVAWVIEFGEDDRLADPLIDIARIERHWAFNLGRHDSSLIHSGNYFLAELASLISIDSAISHACDARLRREK